MLLLLPLGLHMQHVIQMMDSNMPLRLEKNPNQNRMLLREHSPVQTRQLHISFTPDIFPMLLHSLCCMILLRTKLSLLLSIYNPTTPISCPVVAKWDSPAPEPVCYQLLTSHTRESFFTDLG